MVSGLVEGLLESILYLFSTAERYCCSMLPHMATLMGFIAEAGELQFSSSAGEKAA